MSKYSPGDKFNYWTLLRYVQNQGWNKIYDAGQRLMVKKEI